MDAVLRTPGVAGQRRRPVRADHRRRSGSAGPAAAATRHRTGGAGSAALRFGREVGIVGLAVLLYFFVRGLMHGQAALAHAHARDLIDLERRLGVFWEPDLHGWALRFNLLGTLANWMYIWGHWPVIVATLVWLLAAHRGEYGRFRNALLISGGIGLVVFALYPMAPPRFLTDVGFVDTITLHSRSYRVMQPPSLVNQYAAMPSLHVGWDLLMGIAIATQARRTVVRAVGALLPVLMLIAVVLTANHYLTDAVVGSALALFGLAVATRLRAVRPRPVPTPAARQLATAHA